MPGERAARRPRALAQRQEGLEPLIRAGQHVRVPGLVAFRVGDRVNDGVEDHRAHPARKHVRVGFADEGAAGDPVVGQPLVADKPAQIVKIADRVSGRDVSEQAAADFAALAREHGGFTQPAQRRPSRAGNRKRPISKEPLPTALAAKTPHPSALARATHIPTNDIKTPLPRSVQRSPFVLDLHNRATGAARIDKQRADPPPRTSRAITNHSQRDLRTPRMRPFQRNLHPRALQPLPATLPSDPSARGRL